MKEKYFSIEDIDAMKNEHHLYSIHPTAKEDVISNYIETYNNQLISWSDKSVYSAKDIWDIASWEEENPTFYIKII